MPKKTKKTKKPEDKVNSLTKSTVKLNKELVKKFPDIPEMTLMHLAVAISLKYPIYITENYMLLDNKEYFKKTYNIKLMQVYEISDVNNGIIL